MKRTAKLDKFTAHRSKKLGDIGEEITDHLLKVNGFNNVQNLNLLKNNGSLVVKHKFTGAKLLKCKS